MKIISSTKDKTKVRVTNLEDLWYLKQVVSRGDTVGKKTDRSVRKDEVQKAKRIAFYAELKAEKVEYEHNGNSLRVSGKLTKAPDNVELAHHSFSITPGDEVSLIKPLEPYEKQVLEEAVKHSNTPQVLLCAFDVGEAQFAILKPSGVKFIGKLDVPISRREKNYPKQLEDFYKTLKKEIEANLDNFNLKIAIIGGFGPYAEEMKKKFSESKNIHVFKANNAGREGITEMIKSGLVRNVLRDDRISREMELLDEFFVSLDKQDGLWTYGMKKVSEAADMKAVDLLLLVDKMVAKPEVKQLLKHVKNVMIFSSESPSGERLDDMGGIIAKLKFKI